MIRAGINAAIRVRGISGSARVVDHLSAALSGDPEVEAFTVQPRWKGRGNKFLNAAQDCYWDMWRGARTSPPPDVYLSPCNVGRTPVGTRHLLWIHDTVVLDHPEWHDPSYAAYARLFFGLSVRRCTRLVTGTRDSAARIRERWPDAPSVAVIPWPVTAPLAEDPRTKAQRPLSVLMVAATEAHKNHAAAIDAVRQARLFSGEDIRLELVGPPGRVERTVIDYVRTADPDGRWLRRRESVSEEELDRLYGRSWLLLQPAFDEGFGLPLLEAGARALPVVHSGRGGMPEVVPSPVESVASDALCAELLRLLDAEAYTAASRTALEAAAAHSFGSFQDEIRSLVREATG
jgi:glycosyltransferase involved in cell wall biosynthesis